MRLDVGNGAPTAPGHNAGVTLRRLYLALRPPGLALSGKVFPAEVGWAMLVASVSKYGAP